MSSMTGDGVELYKNLTQIYPFFPTDGALKKTVKCAKMHSVHGPSQNL